MEWSRNIFLHLSSCLRSFRKPSIWPLSLLFIPFVSNCVECIVRACNTARRSVPIWYLLLSFRIRINEFTNCISGVVFSVCQCILSVTMACIVHARVDSGQYAYCTVFTCVRTQKTYCAWPKWNLSAFYNIFRQ